jgi:hypothetical protein
MYICTFLRFKPFEESGEKWGEKKWDKTEVGRKNSRAAAALISCRQLCRSSLFFKKVYLD